MLLLLIKDILMHTKLIEELDRTGFDTDDFHQNLSSTIFDLVGLGDNNSENERIYYGYLNHRKKVQIFQSRMATIL